MISKNLDHLPRKVFIWKMQQETIFIFHVNLIISYNSIYFLILYICVKLPI